MPSALQFFASCFQRRTHLLLYRQSQDLKAPASGGTTAVSEPQAVDRLRFALSLPPAIPCSKATKLDQPGLRGIKRETESDQVLLQLHHETLRPPLRPETHHPVVRLAHHNHLATGVPLAPLPCPQVQRVVKVDVRQQRRYHCALGRPLDRSHPTAVLYHACLEPFTDESEHSSVCNAVSQKHQHPSMVDLVKGRRDVRIHYPVHLLALERDRQRIVLASSRPNPIRETQGKFS